jgi:membrane peptidoglycan carboxypeptidase
MTVPEPSRTSDAAGAAGPARGPVPGASPDAPDGRAGRRTPRRVLLRWVRRATAAALVLCLLGLAGFGALLAVTPSAGNAQHLVRELDLAHHVAYPGPPVPARFAAALIATEDHRFYSEPGIDPFAIGRVILARLTGGGDQGGATLYQQLAKLLYTPGDASLTAKAEQVALAVKLDLTYSKAQILRMYADVAYFGHGFYGLAAASCGYFGEQPARLSWAQAAMLAGLVLAPTADDPLVHPARARAREAHVLGRLTATQVLTPAQAATAFAQPLSRLVANSGGGCGNST